ncbi:hypothetical protein [Kutzneria sp. NPDC052558]|uniref:hypothetical protein n=1 Tax=Kutzneria sp. NPDC052558 TaxID=3364121 RepID=UPI0037CB92E3
MSWQEELQQLDSELAQGRVTPEDYRLRRDQLLGVAQGQQPQTPPGGQPQQPAEQPPQASSPFGQPFRWQPPANQQNQAPVPPPAETQSESTQVMRPISDAPAGDSAERTQVVRNTGDGAERTQVVPNAGGFTPGPQTPPPWQSMPQQGMPPQGGPQPQQEYGAAPWSNELPPDFGKASWPLQGPEIFDSGKSSRNTGKIIAIAVAIVLVLGLAGGIYFFTAGSNHDATTTTSTTPKPTTTTSAPPPLPTGPFVQVPGKQVYNVNYSIADAVTNHAPTDTEVGILKNNGAIQVAGVVTENGQMHEGIWAFQAGTGADPKAILNAIDNFYAQSKYQQVTAGIPTGVVARTLAAGNSNEQTAFRAHYISNGYVIRVETYSTDAAAAEKAFRDLLKTETQKYAPAP